MTAIAASPSLDLDHSAVIRATQEYLAALERGTTPDRADFLARFPAIAETLAVCLDNLELLQAAAPGLSRVGLGAAVDLVVEWAKAACLGDCGVTPGGGL